MAAVNDYIFLTQQHFLEQRGNNYGHLLQDTKQDILKNAIKQQTARQEQRFQSVSGKTLEELHDILHSENLIKELNSEQEIDSAVDAYYPNAREAIANLSGEIKQAGTNVEEFKKVLDNFLSKIDQDFPLLRDNYYKAIKANFMANRLWGKVAARGDTEEARLYAAIMDSNYRMKVFRYPIAELNDSNLNSIPSELLRLYTLRGLLDSSLTDRDGFWDGVGKSVLNWVGQIKNWLAENAVLKAYVQGDSKFFEKLLDELHVDIKNTSLSGSQTSGVGISVTQRFEENGDLKSLYEELKQYREKQGYGDRSGNIYSIRNAHTNVSDIKITSSDSNVTGFIGITVKDYESLKIAADGNLLNVHIQSNTPLLTLLLREANFSVSDLITFINIGATIPGFGDRNKYLETGDRDSRLGGDMLVGIWNNLKEQLPYRAVLAALAGFDTSDDQAFFMALNGKIFTIQQVLSSMLDVVNNNQVAAHLTTISGQGLNQWYLRDINDAAFSPVRKGQTIEEAKQERSSNVRQAIMNEFYETKLNVSISLANLSQYISE